MPHVDYSMTTPPQKQLVPPLAPAPGEVLNGRWHIQSTLSDADVWLARDRDMGDRQAVLVLARSLGHDDARAFWLNAPATSSAVLVDTFAFGDHAVGAFVFPSAVTAGLPAATVSRESRALAVLSAAGSAGRLMSQQSGAELLTPQPSLLSELPDGAPELLVLSRRAADADQSDGQHIAHARAWLQRVGADWVWGENSPEEGVSDKWQTAWQAWESKVASRQGDPCSELARLLALPPARKVPVPTAITPSSTDPGAAYTQRAADLRRRRNQERLGIGLFTLLIGATVILLQLFRST